MKKRELTIDEQMLITQALANRIIKHDDLHASVYNQICPKKRQNKSREKHIIIALETIHKKAGELNTVCNDLFWTSYRLVEQTQES